MSSSAVTNAQRVHHQLPRTVETQATLGAFSPFSPHGAPLRMGHYLCLSPALKTPPHVNEASTQGYLHTSELLSERIEVGRSRKVAGQGISDDPYPSFDLGIIPLKVLTVVDVLLTMTTHSSCACGEKGRAHHQIRPNCTIFPSKAKHLEWRCQNWLRERCQRPCLTSGNVHLLIKRGR